MTTVAAAQAAHIETILVLQEANAELGEAYRLIGIARASATKFESAYAAGDAPTRSEHWSLMRQLREMLDWERRHLDRLFPTPAA